MLMPPPLMVAEFREIVLLLIRSRSRLLMPPPLPLAEFSVTELLLIVSEMLLKMPPPSPMAEFPEIVLLLIVSEKLLKMPPPSPEAEFPEIVLLLIVSVLRLKMPPPSLAEFPETELLLIVSVPKLAMPPPSETVALPLVSVSPAIVTLPAASTSKIRDVLLPLIVSWLAPSPLIVRAELIDNCVPPSVMVCPASPAANWIVSAPEVPTAPSTVVPVLAASIASRNVIPPLPSSAALVTVMIAGTIRSSSRSSHQDVPHRRLRRPRFARPIQPRTTDTK